MRVEEEYVRAEDAVRRAERATKNIFWVSTKSYRLALIRSLTMASKGETAPNKCKHSNTSRAQLNFDNDE